MKTSMIVAAMVLFVAIGLSAQAPQKTNQENKKSCYVDKNNNNLCDKYEDGTCKMVNGKGLRDGSGRKNGNGNGRANVGRGTNYIDVNKNGVCDHRENSDKK